MNGLSWLLYAAEVLGNGREALKGALFLLGVAVFLSLVARGAMALHESDGGDVSEGSKVTAMKWARNGTLWFVVAAGFAVVLPSRETIMLIAASEVGETIISSEAAKGLGGEAGQLATDSLRLLRKYISEQVGETEAD